MLIEFPEIINNENQESDHFSPQSLCQFSPKITDRVAAHVNHFRSQDLPDQGENPANDPVESPSPQDSALTDRSPCPFATICGSSILLTEIESKPAAVIVSLNVFASAASCFASCCACERSVTARRLGLVSVSLLLVVLSSLSAQEQTFSPFHRWNTVTTLTFSLSEVPRLLCACPSLELAPNCCFFCVIASSVFPGDLLLLLPK